MHIGNQFSLVAYLMWTRRKTFFIFLWASCPVILYYIFHWDFLTLVPFSVAAVLGTTVAFVISFKNNAAYARLMEAQKIYAEIESNSLFMIFRLKSYFSIPHQEKHDLYIKRCIDLQLVWLTVLRYKLREEKVWENLHEAGNAEFKAAYRVEELLTPIQEALKPYLSEEEIVMLLAKKNPESVCLSRLADLFQELCQTNEINPLALNGLLLTLNNLMSCQYNCFRLKNYPYPRNFYSITNYILNLFFGLLPFSLLQQMSLIHYEWLSIPITVVISWVFLCLEKVGQNTTNPFECGVNDIPISSISMSIEIELKQLYNQDIISEANRLDIPNEIEAVNTIIM